MKKLLITLVLLLGLSAVLWLSASWLIGVKTEEAVRRALSSGGTVSTLASPRFPDHTLLDYQRTLFKAEAITRMDVRHTPLSAWVDELQFQHHIEHGPLLWEGEFDVADLVTLKHEKLVLALSRWQTHLDIKGLDEDIQQWLETVFTGENPFSVIGRVSYEQTVDYQAKLAPFSNTMEEDDQFQLSGVDVSGQFDLQTSQPIALDMVTGLLAFSGDRGRLSFPELNVQLQLDKAQGTHKFTFSAPQADFDMTGDMAGESNPVMFAMQGEAAYRSVGESLEGGLELTLERFTGLQYPLNKIAVDLDFSGLNAEGFYAVNALQNRWQDLRAQLNWNEEEIETPEARRDHVQLELALNEAGSQLLQGIFAKALQKDQSKLQYVFNVETGLGDLSQQANLIYVGAEQAMTPEIIANYSLGDWLSLLRGDIQLDMAKAMLPTGWQSWLTYPIEHRSLLDTEGRYQIDMRLTGYDVELNNRVIVFDQLAEKFMPPSPNINASDDLAITPEILALIEAQGLNSKVLQQLADSNAVPANTLKILRQLQLMNEQLQ